MWDESSTSCIIRELSQVRIYLDTGDFKLCDMALMNDMLAPLSATFVQDMATHDTELDSGTCTSLTKIDNLLYN